MQAQIVGNGPTHLSAIGHQFLGDGAAAELRIAAHDSIADHAFDRRASTPENSGRFSISSTMPPVRLPTLGSA